MKKEFNDDYIIEYLKTLGEVKSYYIAELDGPSSMVIHYVDNDDVVWCLMEEDSELLWACYEYLKRTGTPLLENIEDLKKFEKESGFE